MVENKKFMIERTKKLPLKVYVFSIKFLDDDDHFFGKELVELILDYEFDTAFERIHRIYKNDRIAATGAGFFRVDRLMKEVKFGHRFKLNDNSEPKKIEFIVAEESPKIEEQNRSNNLKSYINNLTYIEDEFSEVLTVSDKTSLKRIIKKIDQHVHTTV